MAVFELHWRNTIVKRVDHLSTIASGLVLAYGLSFLWRTLCENDFVQVPISLELMISYAVQGSALSTAFQTDIVFSTQHKIEIGDLIIDLLRPVRWQFMVFAEYLGLSLAQLAAIAAPVLVLSLLAFGMAGPVSTEAAVLSAISMVLGVTIDFGIVYLTLLLAFRFTHINGFEFAIRGLRPLITGAFVPLWIFPDAVGDVLAFSPSPYIFYAPLSIYVGRVSDTEIFATLGAQAVWVAVMTGSGAYFTSRSMRKLVVQGG